MRVVAVVLAIAVSSCCAHERAHNGLQRLLTALGIKERSPAARLVQCARALGPAKCASALGTWRAGTAVEAFSKHRSVQFNLTADVERFPWERYENVSDETLYLQLNDRTQKLLKYRPISLTLPGLEFRLKSNGFGKLIVDVIRRNGDDSETESSRGMKKYKKKFMELIPVLMIPGLIMSAVLPFILPGLKLMTIAAGMLNNMALSGAIFTMLRNNAFNDYSHKKIIYVNEGYNNERYHPPVYSGSSHFDVISPSSEHVESLEDLSSNWVKQYQSISPQGFQFNNENLLNFGQQLKLRRSHIDNQKLPLGKLKNDSNSNKNVPV